MVVSHVMTRMKFPQVATSHHIWDVRLMSSMTTILQMCHPSPQLQVSILVIGIMIVMHCESLV